MYVLISKDTLKSALDRVQTDLVKLTLDDFGTLTIENDPQTTEIRQEETYHHA